MKKLLLPLMLITYFLCGCGGSGAEPTLKKAHINPTDAIIATTGYDLQIMVTPDPNPVTSIALQATQAGKLIAWPGSTKAIGFGNFPAVLAEVAKYPQFTHIYLYDELGLGPAGPEVLDLSDQTAVLAASTQAREQGLKTVVIYFPNAVLNPAFTLGVVNGVDVIGLDIYPNIYPSRPVPAVYGNKYSDALLACITKLRAMGFTGEIWYVYQAFDLVGNDPVWFQAELVKQRETIDGALGIGAQGIVPWGQYLGAAELAGEPNLIPLENTEPLVIPDGTTTTPN